MTGLPGVMVVAAERCFASGAPAPVPATISGTGSSDPVVVGSCRCLLFFLRRLAIRQHATIANMINSAPTPAPAPMPALAPVLRPECPPLSSSSSAQGSPSAKTL